MSDCPQDRIRLRTRMAAQRGDLSAAQRITAAEGVMHSLERLPEFMVDANVAGYWSVRGEVPLNLVVASLHSRGQHYFLPVLDEGGQRVLHFAEYRTGAALAPNRYGIPEPQGDARLDGAQMDLVLLPLLAFDTHGNRLGTGGGFYDTTFSFLRDRETPGTPMLIGVGYAFQQIESLHAENWDVALDYIATDRELIDCRAVEK